MKHEDESINNQTTDIPTGPDARLCNNLVRISRRNLGDVCCVDPVNVQMLHAMHHRRPDDT